MNIPLILYYMYPNADHASGYKVANGLIVAWNIPEPQPTDQQLADAWIPALKAQKTAEIRRRVVSECEALMPVYEMLYCIRARIVDPRLAQMDTIAKKGRDMEAYINSPGRTEAEVEATSWGSWPT